jgi:hypothetical protein
VYDPHKDFTKRVDFDVTITIYGWPSRGGVIMLENASVVDFNFLRLDRLNPTLLRHRTREEEDTFSELLLLLGAKWWDSVARHWLLNNSDQDIAMLEDSPLPTMRERYWVSVAWPSTGGLVVSEYDTNPWIQPSVDITEANFPFLTLGVIPHTNFKLGSSYLEPL